MFRVFSLSTKPAGRGSEIVWRLIGMASSSVGSNTVDCVHLVLLPSSVVCVKGRRWSLGLLDRAGVGLLPLFSSLPAIVGFWVSGRAEEGCCGLKLGVAEEVLRTLRNSASDENRGADDHRRSVCLLPPFALQCRNAPNFSLLSVSVPPFLFPIIPL
jgi:hypothetical protein